ITSGNATISTAVGQSASGVGSAKVTLKSSTGADLSVTGKADLLNALGLTTSSGAGNATVNVNRTQTAGSLGSIITDG
ncbi:DUF1522 domain-containing protein, partial [Acinetobacter baumannii]